MQIKLEIMDTKDRIQLAEQMKENCKAVREALDVPVSDDDILGVQNKIIDLIEIAGLASRTEVIAKMLHEQELAEAIEIMSQDPNTVKLGPTTMRKIADGKKTVSEYQAAAKYAERLGRNISHSLDALRSILSLQKAQLEQSKWNPGT